MTTFEEMIDSVIINVSKPHRKTNSHNRKSIDNHKLLKRLKFNPEETRRYPFVGVYFDKQKQRLRTYSYNKKFVRQWCASAVRRYKDDISSGSMYKKIREYRWECR